MNFQVRYPSLYERRGTSFFFLVNPCVLRRVPRSTDGGESLVPLPWCCVQSGSLLLLRYRGTSVTKKSSHKKQGVFDVQVSSFFRNRGWALLVLLFAIKKQRAVASNGFIDYRGTGNLRKCKHPPPSWTVIGS